MSGLNNHQLNQVIRWNPALVRHCLATRSATTLPAKIEKYPRAFIANTAAASRPGQHWVAFVVWSRKSVEFFDSYGLPPRFYSTHFAEFVDRYSKVVYNRKELQSIETHVCGQWCLYWLYRRLQGERHEDIVRTFHQDVLDNDRRVALFVYQQLVKPHLYKRRLVRKPRSVQASQNKMCVLKCIQKSIK